MKGTASRAVVLLAGLVCGFAGGSFAQAQDKILKKINWGVTSLSASNWIPWVAKEAKIYEKNGLDVQLILSRVRVTLPGRFSVAAFLLPRLRCRPSCSPISAALIL